uniref:Uncharacterized protein n=1 Tax=Physcomitrium patens TaxID=3218 RepID=A0A7I3Z9F8_PHYPA
MQFTHRPRSEYGPDPSSVEVLLKTLYVKRIAADLESIVSALVARQWKPTWNRRPLKCYVAPQLPFLSTILLHVKLVELK